MLLKSDNLKYGGQDRVDEARVFMAEAAYLLSVMSSGLVHVVLCPAIPAIAHVGRTVGDRGSACASLHAHALHIRRLYDAALHYNSRINP